MRNINPQAPPCALALTWTWLPAPVRESGHGHHVSIPDPIRPNRAIATRMGSFLPPLAQCLFFSCRWHCPPLRLLQHPCLSPSPSLASPWVRSSCIAGGEPQKKIRSDPAGDLIDLQPWHRWQIQIPAQWDPGSCSRVQGFGSCPVLADTAELSLRRATATRDGEARRRVQDTQMACDFVPGSGIVSSRDRQSTGDLLPRCHGWAPCLGQSRRKSPRSCYTRWGSQLATVA